MTKSKNLYIYLISIALIIFYIITFSFILKDDYTYSYKMYYLESKTRFWYGNEGLVVNFGETYDYSNDSDIELKGTQYLGDDFEYSFLMTPEAIRLTEIKLTKSSTIFFEINNKEINSYKIVLEVESFDNINFDFYLNGKKTNDVIEEGKIVINIEDVQKENNLNIKSSEEVRLNSLCFEEM